MTVYALTISLSLMLLICSLALAFWLRRREQAAHGWVALWLGASALFLTARLVQMLNGSAEWAPVLARAIVTSSLLSTWGMFHFATTYLERRPTAFERRLTGVVIALPIALVWGTELMLTDVVMTRVLWGRDAFLGVKGGPLYWLFPVASLSLGVVGMTRLALAGVMRSGEGAVVFVGYVLAGVVLAVDTAAAARGAIAPRFTDFSGLPLAFAFALVQVNRYARVQGELEERVVTRTRELADANERLRAEHADRDALRERLAGVQRMEALGRLAGGVAHDFNNLLTVILGNATLLRASLSGASSRPRLDEIEKAAKIAAELTRQLLVFGSRQALERRVVDVRDIVERVRTLLTRLIGEDVRIDIALSGSPANALVDPTQIEQIVVNLAINARDAMPDGGTLTIGVDVVVLDERTAGALDIPTGPCVRLTVTDTGTGMAPEVRARVFDPFFTTKPSGAGTGLGLSIVYGAAKQNQGAIGVESEVGLGTTFCVYFPVATSPEEARAPRDASVPRGSERVWLVEDQPLVRAFVESALSHLGYSVRSFASGEQLLEVITTVEEADLLVTDLVLPNIDGRALAERVEAARPGMRVVFASGYSEHVVARHGALPTDATFLAKPFTVEKLATVVRQTLDQANESTRSTRCRHALVIDDDPMVLTVVGQLLESLDCVVSTDSGRGDLAKVIADAAATGRPVDLVLLDMNLEDASGLEVCTRLRESGLDVAVLCMSGAAVPPLACTEAGFDGVLEKPLSFEALEMCVGRYAQWSHATARTMRTRVDSRPPTTGPLR